MTDLAMTDPAPGIGTQRERALRNRRIILFGLLAAAGGVVGFTFAMFEEPATDVWLSGTIPAWLAILSALLTAIAMVGGSIVYMRNCDEVDRQNNIHAGACGAVVVMVGYPVWFLLWKGKLLPEPSHMAMFAVLYLTVCAVYIYRKYR